MFKRLASLLLISFVVSCGGGGGDAGTPLFGGGDISPPGVKPASVDLIASGLQVPSGGDQIKVTATVKSDGNVSLASVPIAFSSDSGTLSSAEATTNAEGVASAFLTVGSDRSNRDITVTASSGGVSGNITLPVTGTVLSYSGPTTVALNKTQDATVTASDSKGAPIPGLAIQTSSALGNILSTDLIKTDSQGSATIKYSAKTSGTDSLTFSGGGFSIKTSIIISAENFDFVTPPNTVIPVGVRQLVSVQYLRNEIPQVGKTIAFAVTAGKIYVANPAAVNPCISETISPNATTNASGQASVCISSPTSSPATIEATLTGTPGISAQATLPVSYVAVTPAKVVLQVNPTAISPNALGSTTQKASAVATVTDAGGNPVFGVTVNFNRISDPSGGNLSQASAVTTTSGQATVQYIAGQTTTSDNGVELQATLAGYPAVAPGTARLTVSRSALFIALGTGNNILEIDPQTYQKDWVAYVTDSNGVAVSNVTLTIKVLPVRYKKGRLRYNGTFWDHSTPTYECQNEDQNYNGSLDPSEDFNGDGVLQPGNVISVTTSSTNGASSGTVTTGSTGRATISLVYAKSYAKWVQVRLLVAAVVTGTESSTQAVFYAPGLAADYNDEIVSPPGETSPFGVGTCDQGD